MEWISVEDKLPKLDDRVLVAIDWNTKNKEWFFKVTRLREIVQNASGIVLKWEDDYPNPKLGKGITHWANPPEPPKDK